MILRLTKTKSTKHNVDSIQRRNYHSFIDSTRVKFVKSSSGKLVKKERKKKTSSTPREDMHVHIYSRFMK